MSVTRAQPPEPVAPPDPAETAAAMTSLLLLLAILCVGAHADEARSDKPLVTEACLRCICRATSGCVLKPCEGDNCGLFHISWGYWIDAGRPVLAGQDPQSMEAYRSCVTEPHCAARAVQGYMAKYGQDCNGDGAVDCHDHAALHKLGGFGCRGDLPFKYADTFRQCIAAAAAAAAAAQG